MLTAKLKDKKCTNCNTIFKQYSTFDKLCGVCKLTVKSKRKSSKRLSVYKKTLKQSDTLWSTQVKLRDCNKCVYCGSTKFLNSHHIFSRRIKATRHDLDNGITLCSKHHTFSLEFSAHQTPTKFTYWLENLKGKDFLIKLEEKTRLKL